MKCAAILVAVLVLVAPAYGQQNDNGVPPVDYETARFSRVVTAVALERPITLDGVLEEPEWQEALPARDFTQGGRSPNPGYPASQQTEVRFLYDTENLYIGAICYERDPANMIVNGLKRDFQSNVGDEIGIILDTLNDDRSGIFVSTNPAGAKRDLQASNDSQQNQEWDGVWDVKVRILEDRWTAEFVIPFTTLRFSDSPEQEWGLNMFRKIRRNNEESHWAPLPVRYNMLKISLAGTLNGIEGIRQGRNLGVKPYVTAGVVQSREAESLDTEFEYNGGFDIKYGLTQTLTLDATYRTDFSQAEVDEDQVNLTRFNLFFPEKREFFLENSGVFGFGDNPGRGANLLPFFSRRIGLNPDTGAPIPIVGGTRLSGTMGRQEIGFLMMQTEEDGVAGEEGYTPATTYTVARLKRHFLANSYVGAIFTNRDSSTDGDFNRVFGIDAFFQFWNRLEFSAYTLRSDTPGVSGNQDAHQFSIGWRDDLVSFGADYEKVGDNFNPEVGFVRRDDMSHYSANFSYTPRFRGRWFIRDMTFGVNYDYYEDVNGEIETRSNSFRWNLEFENSAAINFNTNEDFERDEFGRYQVPFGDYKFRDYQVSVNSDRSRLIGGRISYTWGDFWTGKRRSIGGDVTFKPNHHWQIDASLTHNAIRMPAGEFPSTLSGFKVLYAFTSRMFLNTFIQYTAGQQVSTNIRFNFIHRPLSDIYVVFNERRSTVTGEVMDRGVIVKFTNLFTF